MRRLEAAGIETRQAEIVVSEMRDAAGVPADLTMRPVYDFSRGERGVAAGGRRPARGERGVTARRYVQGANAVVISPDVLGVFPDGDVGNAKMKLDVGFGRPAASTRTYVARRGFVDFSYTVTADLDTDGINIPANSITNANTWVTTGNVSINRNHSPLTDQPAHQVFDTPAYISATSPGTFTEANLDGTALTVTLPIGVTFASGVSAVSLALVTAISGVFSI